MNLEGIHNSDIERARGRLIRGQTYKDLSTICLIPTRGLIDITIVNAWWGLMAPMNQNFFRLPLRNMEVGDAYNEGIKSILDNPELSKWKYVLTLEEDNAPPPDGLLKLYEGIQKFDAVGGLYWTKGECGQPMIYGNPKQVPKDFVPQLPVTDTLQECNGLGMGFTLFKLSMFKKMKPPWFRTLQEFVPGQGARAATQDLYFFQNAAKEGFRFACMTSVKVGHWDSTTQTMW